MLILASQSQRRVEILKECSVSFKVVPSRIDETIDEDIGFAQMAERLAQAKAQAVLERYPNDTILAADTMVVLENHVLGKPKDPADAKRMLQALSGKKHQVITGVCLLDQSGEVKFHQTATVYMHTLSELEIDTYIQTKEPLDKAGAYAIQGKGNRLVESYEGDFFTIVGLPIKDLLKHLQPFMKKE